MISRPVEKPVQIIKMGARPSHTHLLGRNAHPSGFITGNLNKYGRAPRQSGERMRPVPKPNLS